MPERFEGYLSAVAEHIRWHRARPFAVRELRTHLLEEKESLISSGMTESEAEESALADMGSSREIGEALDMIHRPREQRFLLVAVLMLSLAGVLVRVLLTWGWKYEMPNLLKTAVALPLGAAALLGGYFCDYRALVRHSGKLYSAAVLLGLFSWRFGPHVNGAAIYTRHVVLLYPVVYALWLGGCRCKGWKGFWTAVLGGGPLALIACMAPYTAGLLLLVVTGFALLVMAAKADWFGVGQSKGLAAVFAVGIVIVLPAAGAIFRSGYLMRRLSLMFRPELDPLGMGYQGLSVRAALQGAQWLGEGSLDPAYGSLPYERMVPSWESDFLFTTLACKWGWLAFLLLGGAVMALSLRVMVKGMHWRNGAGGLAAFAAGMTLAVQTAGGIAANLGFVMTSFSIPFFAGNLHTLVTMMILGVALSVFRQETLPEEDVRRGSICAAPHCINFRQKSKIEAQEKFLLKF